MNEKMNCKLETRNKRDGDDDFVQASVNKHLSPKSKSKHSTFKAKHKAKHKSKY